MLLLGQLRGQLDGQGVQEGEGRRRLKEEVVSESARVRRKERRKEGLENEGTRDVGGSNRVAKEMMETAITKRERKRRTQTVNGKREWYAAKCKWYAAKQTQTQSKATQTQMQGDTAVDADEANAEEDEGGEGTHTCEVVVRIRGTAFSFGFEGRLLPLATCWSSLLEPSTEERGEGKGEVSGISRTRRRDGGIREEERGSGENARTEENEGERNEKRARRRTKEDEERAGQNAERRNKLRSESRRIKTRRTK